MFSVRRWPSLRRVIPPSALRSTVPHFVCKPRWIGSLSKPDCSLPRYSETTHKRLGMMRSISLRCRNIWLNRYKRTAVAGLGILATGLYYASLEEVPVTGRKRCNILPKKLMVTIGQYGTEGWLEDHQEMDGHLLHVSDDRFAMTKRVMKRITRANGLADEDWRVYIFDDDSVVHAFVMPNGSLFMYSGMFEVCQNEDGLAALLGHEIAHVVASHSAETFSAIFARHTILGSVFFLAGGLPGLFLFGAWNVLGGYIFDDISYHLPKSRMQECEADYIGLMMMAKAGYNPQEAVGYWQRMKAVHDQDEVDPEHLRTHPPYEKRISNVKEWMAQALAKREEIS